MTDAMLRRRDFAAAALLAFTPLFARPANAKLKIVSGGTTSSGGSTSASTSTSTSTKTTTTTTTTTASVDTCAYGLPVLDAAGHANFANRSWGLHRDTSKSYAIEQSVDLTLKRHRFEVRSGDTWNNEAGRNRAEYCCTTKESNHREIWFSHAMRVHGGAPVSDWNVLGQFHSTPDPGEPSPSPPFSFNLIPGEKLRIVKRTDPNPMTTASPNPTVMYEKTIVRDHWYRFVGRVVFGWADDAACEIWMDGVKVVNLPVTNMGFNDLVGPYWKFGIYRAAAAETLVVEYANLEIGSSSLLSRVTSPLPII